MSENFKRTVEASYERIAKWHLATKDPEDPVPLAALGAWEGWRASMRWSHYDGETGLGLLRGAGFAVERAEVPHHQRR